MITKIYTSAVLTIATLDTAVFEIGAVAKWLLKILVIMMAGLLAQLIIIANISGNLEFWYHVCGTSINRKESLI